jgi:hypothetical protein
MDARTSLAFLIPNRDADGIARTHGAVSPPPIS